MDKFTFEQRQRLENEVLPAVIDDPEYAASTIVRLESQLAEARESMREAYEVYAGSDGIIPETAPEAYQQRLLNQIAEILGKALAGGRE